MRYEIQPSEQKPGEYAVSGVDDEGQVHAVLFSGPNAKHRAEEYVAWKNRETDAPNTAPLSR